MLDSDERARSTAIAMKRYNTKEQGWLIAVNSIVAGRQFNS
jgi:hypothetical protein